MIHSKPTKSHRPGQDPQILSKVLQTQVQLMRIKGIVTLEQGIFVVWTQFVLLEECSTCVQLVVGLGLGEMVYCAVIWIKSSMCK